MSCSYRISVLVLKNYDSKLSHKAQLLNIGLKISCFPDFWKVSSVAPAFKNIGERSTAKKYLPVGLLSEFSKIFEELVNNGIVNHLEKSLFSDFQCCFRSSQSIADLLPVVSDGITRAFNSSRATRAVVLDTSKAFDGVWHDGILHKLKCYGISGGVLDLISPLFSIIDGFEWFWMGSHRKNVQLKLDLLNIPISPAGIYLIKVNN